VNLGLVAGINRASLGGDGGDASGLTRARAGYTAGVELNVSLSQSTGFRPEMLYSQKGGRAGADANQTELRVDYVEVPALFYMNGNKQQVRPTVYGGPYAGVRVNCSVRSTVAGTASTVDCGTAGLQDFRHGDFGVVVGAGFETGRFNAGVRFVLGLSDIARAPSPVNTRVFSFLAGYRLGL
jgi:outer membrane immunogenic protein